MASYLLGFCRIVIGLVFTWSFLGKLRNVSAFVQVIDRFKLLPKVLHRIFAVIVLVVELTVAVTMLLGKPLLIGGFLLAMLMLLVFCMALASVLIRKIQTPCNCFGSSAKPVSIYDIIRNMFLFLCALIGFILLLISKSSLSELSWLDWGLVSVTAIVAVFVSAQSGEIVRLFKST
jgi:uncharacterized membrane protein YphA (DoxX/SURF4 family)